MSTELPHFDVLQRVQALRDELNGLTTVGESENRLLSTGCEAFDRLLPGNGFSPGSLVEWLAEGRASGAGCLAVHVARQTLQQQHGSFVVADRWRRFYPPAAVGLGIDPRKLIVIRPGSAQEELWALDQALRCPGVGAVLAWIDQLDALAFRRLQLAAEAGRTLGLLVRPANVRHRPTWSEIQLLVQPVAPVEESRLRAASHVSHRICQVTLLRQRGRVGAREGSSVKLEIDEQQHTLHEVTRRHETRHLHLAPRMASSTTRRRSAGA